MHVYLITAVTQCNKLPTRIREIASELEQLFKVANHECPRIEQKGAKSLQRPSVLQQGSLLLEDKHKRALEKYKTPVRLANYDCALFLTKYFLDQNGKPDPSKTPFALLLPGLSDKLALQKAADTIPGLKTSIGGEGEFRILVIGWNRTTIFEIAEQMSTDQARLRDEMSPQWQQHLRKHYRLIKALPVSSKSSKLKVESAQGTYAIECRGATENWCDSPYEHSSLRITYSKTDGWVGIFSIGIIYGVMRLSTDRKALLARCKATERNESRIDGFLDIQVPLEELSTTEEEDNASEEEDVFSDLSDLSGNESEERNEKDETGPDGLSVFPGKRKEAPTKAHANSAKRLKLSQSTPCNRLYFKWRGREKGEGDVAYDLDKKNTGYLQFTDANCIKFESTISHDLIGKNVLFQGFKISDDGGAVTRTYRDYSERAGSIIDYL